MRTTIPAAIAALVAGFAIGGPAVRAASDYVDLELILAVDVSRSMDYDEQKVQRDGYVKALRSPEILQAIRSGPFGRIAITYMEWSSSYYQQTLVPWTIVATADDIAKFTNALAAAPITTDSRTSIANALLYAQAYFNKASYNTDRRTVDVSGDGSNNDGSALVPVRDRLVADGIVINGLPILIRPSNIFGSFGSIGLDDYYKACVTGGPGSFVIPIQQVNEFESAIRRKLILEIASVPSDIVPVSALRPATPNVDCNAAEQQRNFNDPSFFP
jgi:hypothetical protein